MPDYLILIEREKALYGSAIKHSVELDGLSVGTLGNGQSLSIHTAAGPHILSFIKKGKQEKSVSLMIGQEEHITNLSVRLNSKQKIEVSKSSQGALTQSNSKKAKKKSGIPKAGRIAIGVVAAFVLLVALFGEKSSNQTDRSTSVGPGLATVEQTDEEKAAEQLEKASEKFQNGKYMDAINICDNILSDYPDTDVASNIDSYLDEQFSQFPHYSATDLFSAYDANVVNADEQYTNAVLVVSGTVSSIAKTNNGNNLAVMLKSGAYFNGVQLNFKTSQTDAVAALNEGDTITAIGKCTGKSGTQFLILDGNNVMIENCYLIEA